MLACTAAQPASQSAPQDHALNIPASEMKWQKIFPEAGERSAEDRHPSFGSQNRGDEAFITVDGPWDINWVNGPPKPSDLMGGVRL
jgi:hypothetical protein